MFISICTQIKNRIHQLKQTIDVNIETLKKHSDVEWVVVDYESTDGLDEYIKNYIEKYEFIKYYQTKNAEYSIPIAKNLCARLSIGNYLFNLDCDNFLDDIIEQIKTTDQGVFCNEYLKGTFGRIGLHKNIFKQLGGYDENFYPSSVHDNDLLLRCINIGYEFKNIPNKTPAIDNSKEDTVCNFKTKLSWEKMKECNLVIMKYNQRKKITNPNNNIFTPCSLVFNFKEKIEKNNEF